VTFGTTDNFSAPISSSPTAIPAIKAEGVKSFGSVPVSAGHVNGKPSMVHQCLGLASSYLLTDTGMNAQDGGRTWFEGFSSIVDVLCALHARGELEVDTVNEASKACSECWSVSGSWRGLDEGKEGVRVVAGRLMKLLDENGRTYRGESVYTPG
jgi:hypothetical protein